MITRSRVLEQIDALEKLYRDGVSSHTVSSQYPINVLGKIYKRHPKPVSVLERMTDNVYYLHYDLIEDFYNRVRHLSNVNAQLIEGLLALLIEYKYDMNIGDVSHKSNIQKDALRRYQWYAMSVLREEELKSLVDTYMRDIDTIAPSNYYNYLRYRR